MIRKKATTKKVQLKFSIRRLELFSKDTDGSKMSFGSNQKVN